MKHGNRAARSWWLALGLIPLMAVGAMAGPSDGTALVGNATSGAADSESAGKKRDDETITKNSWSSTGAKGATQRNINEKVKFVEWDAAKISDAKAMLNARRASDSGLDAKLKALENVGQRLPYDLHPAEYLEWLKLQTDKDSQFIRPPPNKIQIVDQEKLSTMDKTKIAVKYKRTKVCPRVITYKPVYKTITVYYPG
jgi:hypothetical protein